VANRFVRRIRSGEIDSVEGLKAEFKSLAKLSHPDLAGPGADHLDFASLRGEYENALRDFVKHRFGARKVPAAATEARGAAAEARGDGPLSDEAWACLALFLKRGFPKIPRHEKEALRYEYARWRLREALGPELAFRLDACEAELLALKAEGSRALAPALALLRELVDYRARGLSAMRTQILLSLGSLGADPRIGRAFTAFARSLAAELGIGGEISAPRSDR
jgi:hypothetical protein